MTYSDGQPSGDCPVTLTRTWTATDDCGNSSSCTQTVVLDDDVPPTITCPPNVTIECDESIHPNNTGAAQGADTCSSVMVTYSDAVAPGTCPSEGVFTRTWTATDLCGNTATCDQTIKVEDSTPPTIVCPPDVTVDCTAGGGNTGTATATDNCGSVTVTFSDGAGSGDCPATFTRTWTATDECGNSASCDQDISINDDTPPTIACPPNVTVECDESTDPSYTGTPNANDDCSGVNVTYSDSVAPGTCDEEEVITRTWTATDGCGNTATCSQTLTVRDTTAPTITCPPSATLDCEGTISGQPTVDDNCDSNPSVTYSDGQPSGDCPVTLTRTWTATDDCGNSSSCTQTVVLDDDVPPVMTCPLDVTLECDASTDPADTGGAQGADTCSSVTITYVDSTSLGSCPSEYTIVRTWTVTDVCGNSVSCNQTIELEDTTPPTITCPPDVTIDCDAGGGNTGAATADDNCILLSVTFSDGPGAGDCPATFIRTWTATDACGNSTSCDQIISINDDTPPVIVCPVNVDGRM